MARKKHVKKVKDIPVVAVNRTRMGISSTYIPKGTTGMGHKYMTHSGEICWNVTWSRGNIGSHKERDIKPTPTKE